MSFQKIRRAVGRLMAGALLLAAAAVALASPSASPKEYTAVAPDGVKLAVQESGDPRGSPIIFVHGLLGSRLSWTEQLKSRKLQRHRLITYDLRGHGLSDRPAQAQAYTEGQRWGDDLAAVMEAAHATRPVVAGWSLGGAVITNYLTHHGDSKLAGIVYVDGVIELSPGQIAAHPGVQRDMTSADLRTHLDGERAFLRLCFHRQPDQTTFDRLLGAAALASWQMQASIPSMSIVTEGLSKARVPVLLIYGAQDALVLAQSAIARASALNSRVRSRLYAGSGHAPFIEEPQRFNHDLTEFVESTAR